MKKYEISYRDYLWWFHLEDLFENFVEYLINIKGYSKNDAIDYASMYY